jgi:hypothetical protein
MEGGAAESLQELVEAPAIPKALVGRIATRLAQGADTNRRGHGMTTVLRERLEEWGFSARIGNANETDTPVSDLAPAYTGPRKYDTVVYDPSGQVRLVSQSQFYSSDTGSIQGKSIEEDATANRAVKAVWPDAAVLTHTEGFGCHTTMLSRLRHVLSSDIDGFIQLRTLDTKLRYILRQLGVVSLVDFEIVCLMARAALAYDDLVALTCNLGPFQAIEVELALRRYLANGKLQRVTGDSIGLLPGRLETALYYVALDDIVSVAAPISELALPYWRVGGLPSELGVEEPTLFATIAAALTRLDAEHGLGANEVIVRMVQRGVVRRLDG